ncbi:MAG: serine/threonine-protein kinase [Desulfobacterales bacterium]
MSIIFGVIMSLAKTVGNYRFIDYIGSGGMGEVYIGEDIHLKRRVAIKALKQELMCDTVVIERFKLEAVTLAKLNHPNVAAIYAFLEEDDNCYIVTELISGWQLSTFIEKIGALPIPLALYFFKQVLSGISAVHENHIVHRDLKPSNIMINTNLIAKVTDFGIARFQAGKRLTKYDKLVGTIEYMSPEQILGKDVTLTSDIYSLGVLLFEMVTGRIPFSGDSDYELMKCQVESLPPSPLEFKTDVPERLIRILSQALDKNPQMRFPSADAFKSELDKISADASEVRSEIHEIIQSNHLENYKTTDCHLTLTHGTKNQNHINIGKSKYLKKRTPTFTNKIYGRLIVLFTPRPWLGPLILFFSILIAAALILSGSIDLNFNSQSHKQQQRKEEDQIGRTGHSENEYKLDMKASDSINMPMQTEINSGSLQNHDMNLLQGSGENIHETSTGDQQWKATEKKHIPLNPVQSSAGIAPPSTQLKPKVKPSFQQGSFTKGKVNLQGESKSETEKPLIDAPLKNSPTSTTVNKKKNNEWVIHK